MTAQSPASSISVLPGGPMSREQVVQQYFLEHRAKLLDIAAYLDRIDRATAATSETDFRDQAFRQAVQLLTDGKSQRARRILELLSDHTSAIPQSAHGMKGASGAVKL